MKSKRYVSRIWKGHNENDIEYMIRVFVPYVYWKGNLQKKYQTILRFMAICTLNEPFFGEWEIALRHPSIQNGSAKKSFYFLHNYSSRVYKTVVIHPF